MSRQVFQRSAASTVGGSVPPMEYLSQNWFPINGVIFAEIKRQLDDGFYKEDRKALIKDLKKDFALLTHCLRCLRGHDLCQSNPLKIFEKVSYDELKEIFAVSEGEISSHSIRDILKPQANRFKHALISSTAAEVLAEGAGVDPELAYGASLFAQTGLNLVAWNYPRVYAKALSAVAEGKGELEPLLKRSLGFSPREMGLALTIGLESKSMAALGMEEGEDTSNLTEICKLAEEFAQANDPDTYPEMTRQWNSIVDNIQRFAGISGLTTLKSRIVQSSTAYTSLNKNAFEVDFSYERNLEVANQKVADAMILGNPDVAKLSEPLRDSIRRVYSRIQPGRVSPEALQFLIAETLPLAGFHQGCVYLFENKTQALIPKLRIGVRPIEEYKPLLFSAVVSGDNPILEAYQSSFPIRREGAVMFGDRVTLIAGLIGSGDRDGVLYLETADELSISLSHETILKFKALRCCMSDCLNFKTKTNQ